ncbi:helix-turn-helix domain-containing protein [Proteinivorax tanatarense]|uniref:Helix-turn-helix domain-containing protein n=1 Tax=Proteinivorax tanatarense TaxID=1260629 RepID=A0AAU7VHP5_9FIRM
MTFGDKLRKLREAKGLTQAELGKLIGVSDRVLGYYESNTRFPNKAQVLQNISEVFDVSIDYLIGNEDAFIQNAKDNYGSRGAKQAKEVLESVESLFAGGELPEEDVEEFFKLVTEMYFEAKQKNKKYGRNKED